MRYVFREFVLDVEKHELRRGDTLVAVEPQVFALLAHLIGQRERVVSREELIETIWEGRFVSDSVVSSRIKSARKVLGDDGRTQSYIKTIHGTGFRFVAAAEEASASEPSARSAAAVSAASTAPANDSAPPTAHHSNSAPSVAPTVSRQVVFGGAAVGLILFALIIWTVVTPARRTTIETSPVASAASAPAAVSSDGKARTAAIAVLPFDDFSQERDQEYFADGIAEELLNALAQVDGLQVTSRTSSFAFKGRNVSAGEIAQALGVRHVLEGSVRKAGPTMRITAQLIDAQNDIHLWSQTYDRALTAENLFAVQDEISQAIVSELQGRINSPTLNPSLKTDSTEAYDAYLRGRSLISRRTADAINAGIEELRRATTLDANFAPVHSSLVDAYVLASSYAGLSREEAGALAAPHAARALALAPDAPESLAAKGRSLSVFDNHDAEAIQFYKRAIEANPNFAEAHRLLALSHSTLSHIDDAKASFETARRLNPLAPVIFANLFRTNWDKGDLYTMLALGEESSRLNPDSIFARQIKGGGMRESGNYAAAHRLLKDNQTMFGASKDQLADLYHMIGRDDLAAPFADPYLRARIALRDGETDSAVALIAGGEPYHEVAVLRWAGELDAAYAQAKADIARRSLLSDATQVAVRYQTFDIYYAQLLDARSDPAADIYRARLANWFDGKSPNDFRLRDSYYAGVLWQIINGDVDAAFLWLDALIDANHVWPDIAIEPLFDPIRDSDAFQIRLTRLEENAARHRAAIELQLTADDGNSATP